MSAHTPGPWSYVGSDRGIDAEMGERGWFVEVCPRRHVSVQGRTGNEAEANARLIASAPELLEALRQIIADMDSDFGTGYDYELARAAIAKATQP